MALTVTVRDESTSAGTLHEMSLDFLTEKVTVRELIRSRVYQEVQDHNLKGAKGIFRGLVQPGDAERELNGFRLKQPREIDWKKQLEVAVESFKRAGFLIIVDDKQVTDIDEEVTLRAGSQVSFLKLVPLVGG